MKTTEYISNTIDRLPKGYVFTYEDFITEVNKKEAVIKALNRMATSSRITQSVTVHATIFLITVTDKTKQSH